MSEIKLFSLLDGVKELPAKSVHLEKELQNLIEKNMEMFFGVKFLSSEYIIKNGRIDSLGLDENFCPVILEYKRSLSESVINQGLFYLDWLLDHKADFKLLVMEKLGKDVAEKIDWSVPQVICIANDFTKYDIHAVNQMGKNIKLIRYKKYNNDFLLFELLNTPDVKPILQKNELPNTLVEVKKGQRAFLEQFETTSEDLKNIYLSIKDYILSLGDDISENQLKLYVAFKKIKNFVCVEVYQKMILLHLSISPSEVELKDDFIKDVSNVGHYGTGNVRVIIRKIEDFEKSKYLLEKAYNEA